MAAAIDWDAVKAKRDMQGRQRHLLAEIADAAQVLAQRLPLVEDYEVDLDEINERLTALIAATDEE